MKRLVHSNLLRTLSVLVLVSAFLGVTAATAAPPLITNGDFETGDLNGWTTFTTQYGTIGTPAVVPFDTTGSGISNAARFKVGRVPFPGAYDGGGIYQNVTTVAGLFDVSADVAADPGQHTFADCGKFELLVDDNLVSSVVFMDDIDQSPSEWTQCLAGTTTRGTLSAPLTLSAGTHEVRIRITRWYQTDATTPDQYVDNVNLTLVQAADTTPPTVLVTGVENGKTYIQGYNQPVAGCQTTDAGSGVATPASLQLSSTVPGPVTATCSGGTDQAGNVAPPVSVSYTVETPAEGLQAAIIAALGTGSDSQSFQRQAAAISSASNANAKAGKLQTFIDHVNAQTGKRLTPVQAAEVIALAKLL